MTITDGEILDGDESVEPLRDDAFPPVFLGDDRRSVEFLEGQLDELSIGRREFGDAEMFQEFPREHERQQFLEGRMKGHGPKDISNRLAGNP